MANKLAAVKASCSSCTHSAYTKATQFGTSSIDAIKRATSTPLSWGKAAKDYISKNCPTKKTLVPFAGSFAAGFLSCAYTFKERLPSAGEVWNAAINYDLAPYVRPVLDPILDEAWKPISGNCPVNRGTFVGAALTVIAAGALLYKKRHSEKAPATKPPAESVPSAPQGTTPKLGATDAGETKSK